MGENLAILSLVVGGASVLPFAARRFRIPSAVMEIIFGMILFNTALGHKPEWFHFLKELGFIYLMFIAGMELDLRDLLRNRVTWWYVAIPSLSFLVAPLAFHAIGLSFFAGIVLSMVSAGIVVPVLKEAGLVRSAFGRHAVGVALAGELVSIIVLTGIDVYHRYGLTFLAAVQVLKLATFLLLAAVTLRAIYLFAWWNPHQVKRVMESDDPVEEGIRIAISVVVAGAFIAHGAGVEPIVGSFIAGVIFTSVFRNRSRFEEKINALGFGFFVPFFFIGVGADFDVTLFASGSNILAALAMAGVILLSNSPAVMMKDFLGLRLREAFLMALLLSAPLSMIVVAGTIGYRMGLIGSDMKNIFILAALFASLVYPLLFRMLSGGLEGRETEAS